jgi:hypothetical protein
MRSFKTLPCVAAGVLLALSGAAQAATTGDNFEVTANVVAACSVIATDLAFGDFDGSGDLANTSPSTRATRRAPRSPIARSRTPAGTC